MTNDISLASSTVHSNVEKAEVIDHSSLTHENNPIKSVSQNHYQNPSLSYLTLSIGDNEHLGSSDFQDPLFYDQPLHFHYNQPMQSTIPLGHETGDRVQLTNEIKFNEYRKQTPLSSSKHRIDKTKSSHRKYTNSKKFKTKIIQAKEKNKKRTTESVNKRKLKNKKMNIQQFRHQSKARQESLLKHRRQQQILLKKKKKKLLKQPMVSKKGSKSKINKNKSLTSTRYNRKINLTNNRIASTISSHRSLMSRLPKIRSITHSNEETIGIRSLSQMNKNLISHIRLMNNFKTLTLILTIICKHRIKYIDSQSRFIID